MLYHARQDHSCDHQRSTDALAAPFVHCQRRWKSELPPKMLCRETTKRSIDLLRRDARRLARAAKVSAASTASRAGATCLLSAQSSGLAVDDVPVRGARQFSLARGTSARDLSTEPVKKLNVKRLAVIGGGNMAEAIVTALASKGLIDPASIVVSDPNPGALLSVLYMRPLVRVCEANSAQ